MIDKLNFLNQEYLSDLLDVDNAFPYKRKIFSLLREKVKNSNICLVGLRQIGKTVLMKQIAIWYFENYINKTNDNIDNKVKSNTVNNKDKIFYTNIKSIKNINNDKEIWQKLLKTITNHKYQLIVLDEIQELDDWSNFLQSAIDLNKQARFIVSGSNIAAIRAEKMVGRMRIVHIKPLLFSEFKDMWQINDLHTYLKYGSYPKNCEDKNITSLYVELVKDTIIDKIIFNDYKNQIDYDKFYSLIYTLNNYIGNEYNTNKLSIGITRQILPKYIKIMQDAELIKFCPLYKDKNAKRKLKIYYEDKSMLYYFNQYIELNNNQIGALIENVVFNFLEYKFKNEDLLSEICYYRDSKQNEIDFILDFKKTLIECKYVDDKHFNKQTVIDHINKLKEKDSNINDFKTIIITKNINEKINDFEFISLENFLGDKYEW